MPVGCLEWSSRTTRPRSARQARQSRQPETIESRGPGMEQTIKPRPPAATNSSPTQPAGPNPLQPVVAAAILDSLAAPTRVLAAARSYPAELRGMYEFPGGKVEPGEQPKAALAREIAEELSADLEYGAELACPGSPAGWPLRNGRTMRVWLAELAPGESPSCGGDHEDLSWRPIEKAGDLPWLPSNSPIVEQLQRELLTQSR